MSNVSEKDDGRQVTTSSVTFFKLTATDGGLVRCKASSPTAETSADAFMTVIGIHYLYYKIMTSYSYGILCNCRSTRSHRCVGFH